MRVRGHAWLGALFDHLPPVAVGAALAREVSALPPDDDALFRADAGRERVAGAKAKDRVKKINVTIPTSPHRYTYVHEPAFLCLFNIESGECVRHYPRRRGRGYVLRRRDQLNRIWGRKAFGVR